MQVCNILELRTSEEAKTDLSISVYNVERNEKACKYRQEQVWMENITIFIM